MTDGTSAVPVIMHYVAGGTENGGGIGRLVGYILNENSAQYRHSVVDTRGPRWNPLVSPWHLAHALFGMTANQMQATPRLHHLHIAGRGSTARKIILGAWARLIGAPYVLHLHDYDYASDLARRPKWQFRAIKSLFQGAAQVIVLGQRDAATVGYSLDVPKSKLTVLRNCVPDPGETLVDPRTKRRRTSILFLGQLGPRKGVPELLAALASTGLEDGTWQAVIAGDGPIDHYRSEAALLGLSGRVRFPGWVDADGADRLRKQADILVLPSHAEGFAMAVLEGLAQGLAVITTRVGAHDEVLVDGQNALLVPPGDVPALSVALTRLINDEALRTRLGAEGRRLFLSQFGIDGYVDALERLQSAQLPVFSDERRSA
ncbi:glycosyltransferase family 4 protein [Roseobacter sp. GAI101]|uniref:glycosyltransferase family 4 protein n=1 Tax=Roseobacter sp. (strain GAI101) TaxID=391589 RepID=UPI0003154D20|nr:glycosyltransferase family 4 protein [Roseobacter sp. GAI101]